MAGKQYLSPLVADLTSALTTGNCRQPQLTSVRSFSRRDRSALPLAAQGYVDAEIAFFLKLTSAQVTRLRTRLMRRLGLRTQVDLAALARQHRLRATWD